MPHNPLHADLDSHSQSLVCCLLWRLMRCPAPRLQADLDDLSDASGSDHEDAMPGGNDMEVRMPSRYFLWVLDHVMSVQDSGPNRS